MCRIDKALFSGVLVISLAVSSCGGGSGSGGSSTSTSDWHLQLTSTLNTEISPDGSNALYPQVAMDGQGNAVVAWGQAEDGVSSPQPLMSELRNGVWINPASRTDFIGPGGGVLGSSPVAMNSQGDALIAWAYGSPPRILLSEFRNGLWTHPVTDNDSISVGTNWYAPDPVLAMDNVGNALVLWSRAEGLFLSEYRNGAWVHPASALDTFNPGGGTVGSYSVAMDDLGNALIAWTQNDNNNHSRILISEYRNGAWLKPASVADSISPAGSSTYGSTVVTMDNLGNALVVWLQYDAAGDRQVFLSEYRSGAWTHPASLADNISADGTSVVTFDASVDNLGNAIITWFQATDPNLPAYTTKVFRSEYRNNAWIHPSGMTDYISDPAGNGEYPAVAMSDQGNAALTWLQYDSDAMTRYLHISEYVNGAWSQPRAVPDTYSANNEHQVVMNGQGKYLLVWTRPDTNGTQKFDPSTIQVFATRSE